jgi:hypothetical protein
MPLFTFHHYHHVEQDPEAVRLLKVLYAKDDLILKRLETIMSALDDLQAAVAAEDTVIDSAITLIKGIPGLIAAAGTDPAKLQALSADIMAKSQALASAVAANTPAVAPAPAATPASSAAPADATQQPAGPAPGAVLE